MIDVLWRDLNSSAESLGKRLTLLVPRDSLGGMISELLALGRGGVSLASYSQGRGHSF